ncbi:uncharacterized protein PGRI_089770 [Penicillium griseofulvum]|uniref:Uncharacterized protein n=1 Tax=Penicillium patulum TaxID=5078 RepID=A0A135LRI5_PENPA|nr:uncharacterized protein PGRI_089770 [Penicillium griseofulvum]KXG51584.1 hypothetical protein PGRI_089770 [Penicillium griseofulvum]
MQLIVFMIMLLFSFALAAPTITTSRGVTETEYELVGSPIKILFDYLETNSIMEKPDVSEMKHEAMLNAMLSAYNEPKKSVLDVSHDLK